MSAIRTFLSAENEPLRRYLYGVLVAVLALLGVAGLITGTLATALGGVLVAVLVIPAVEVARGKVSPVPVPDAVPAAVPVPAETGDVN